MTKIRVVGKFIAIALNRCDRYRCLALAVTVLLLLSCSAMDDFERHRAFVESEVIGHPKIRQETIESNGRELAYVQAGNPDRGIVIWLHGTPGSWSDIGSIMISAESTADLLWVSVDRMGWGDSSQFSDEFGQRELHSRYFATLAQQQAYLRPLVQRLREDHPEVPVYVAGHSWGGSLAPALALASPEISGLLIVAGGLSPEAMKVRWYHRLADTWLARRVIGSELQRATEEMLALPAGLSAINEQIARDEAFRALPIIILQGGEDSLVPVDNANYWGERFTGSQRFENLTVVIDEDFGHLWHMQRPAAIAACVEALVSGQAMDCAEWVKNNDD